MTICLNIGSTKAMLILDLGLDKYTLGNATLKVKNKGGLLGWNITAQMLRNYATNEKFE